jgi:hypothetical protein
MTRRIALAGAALAAGGLGAVLFHPDADGTAAWGIAVAINGGLICLAAALLAAVVTRR